MGEARLFSIVCSDRTWSNGLELEHRKLCTDMWKNFFTVRVTEHWNRLPREVVESPSMEIFKIQMDTFLRILLEGTCFSRGLNKMISRDSLKHP